MPLPVAPALTVIQVALLVAVHAQPVPALTVIAEEPEPPSGPKVVVGCTTLNAHEGPVVGAVSFLLHAAAKNDAAIAMIHSRDKRRSNTMRDPPPTVEDT